MLQAPTLLPQGIDNHLSPTNVKLLEVAWQLVVDHILFLEGPKLGSWAEAIQPGSETCQRLYPSLTSREVADLMSESAFQEYAKGYFPISPKESV